MSYVDPTAAANLADQAATAGDHYDTAKAALNARIARISDFDQAHAGQLGHVFAYAASQAVIDYRDRGNLDQAVETYDYATRRRFLPRLLGPNRYPARCATCTQPVAAGAGVRGDLPDATSPGVSATLPPKTRNRHWVPPRTVFRSALGGYFGLSR